MDEYETAKEMAKLDSVGTGEKNQNKTVDLDVHALNELQKRGVPLTNDSYKYSYNADKNGNYNFTEIDSKILAIRVGNEFVNEISEDGALCGIILDNTMFYAESGGQQFDMGFITSTINDFCELTVRNVQVRRGYVLHEGHLEGRFRVNDVVKLLINVHRREGLMRNHTGTHVLNFSLRKVLGEADQKGSLVAPEKLRFDFTARRAMTKEEIANTEKFAKQMIYTGGVVYTQNTPLATAKNIQGLRAVFGEVYPDPVRVVSVGVDVEILIADPMNPAGSHTSVEFCGGTHVLDVKHIGEFVILSEEAIAKGIRRITAVTGQEADRALKCAIQLEQELESLLMKLKDMNTVENAKHLNSELLAALDNINQAPIGHCKRDFLKERLSNARKEVDSVIREVKQIQNNQILEEAKQFVETLTVSSQFETKASLNETLVEDFWSVYRFKTRCNDSKTVNNALKILEKQFPNRAFLVIASDMGKVLCMSLVPEANEWIDSVQSIIEAKGGGKPGAAQAMGSKVENIDKLLKAARIYARDKVQ